jgi:hypothetical protein
LGIKCLVVEIEIVDISGTVTSEGRAMFGEITNRLKKKMGKQLRRGWIYEGTATYHS